MKKSRILILILLFLSVLTGFRLLWLHFNSIDSPPVATKGVLDLRDWQELRDHSLPLNGEWEFYPGAFLYGDGRSSSDALPSARTIRVPGNWTFEDRPFGNLRFGYGTYRLKILVPADPGRAYGVRISSVHSSSAVYLDGQLLGQSGQPAANKAEYEPRDTPYTAFFAASDNGEIELVVQAANFDHFRIGGIARSIQFGQESVLRHDLGFFRDMAWVACVAYAIHVLYGFILYLVGGRDKKLLYFSLMILCIIIATLMDGERLLLTWVDLPPVFVYKFVYVVMLAGGFSLYQLFSARLPRWLLGLVSRIYLLACGFSLVFVLLLPLPVVMSLEPLYLVLMLYPCLTLPFVLYRSTARIDTNNVFLLLAAIASITSLVWLIFLTAAGIEMVSYPFDLIVAMICFSAFWFKRFFRLSEAAHRLSASLRAANKQKDDFLATVAHELRNPLHGMINLSESIAMRERGRISRVSAEDLGLLSKVGRRMSYILNDLLDMARLKENRIRLVLADVSAHGAASSVIDALRFMTEGKPIRLINRIPADFPLVRADENRLNQILFNLLHNAIKYSDAGEVSVEAKLLENRAIFTVADDGVGIKAEHLGRIFEPYVQALENAADSRGGFGLGLGISRRLVELHGSQLSVRSKPNEGSRFSFTLQLSARGTVAEAVERPFAESAAEPLAEPETPPAANPVRRPSSVAATTAPAAKDGPADDPRMPYPYSEPAEPRRSPERFRLLAVDDDPVNLNVLKTILSDERCEVVTANDGQEALRLIDTGSWDLVLSDVTMPLMSGYELTARIRERFSVAELPVLLLTARDRHEDKEAGFLAGANDYVAKPVNATELRMRVQSLTNLKRAVNDRLRMEAALLQARIKPHFMINTFNSVSALSKIDIDQMDELIGELTHYYRLGIDLVNSDQAMPLERELNLVRSYLAIQKKRFEDRLRIVWEADDNVRIDIPPLTIQPLVENAVTHGVLKRTAGGEVRIRVADLGGSVEIEVSDDGVGIGEDRLPGLLVRNPDGVAGSSLINTDRRLKQFGSSGLRIESRAGQGTKVSFTVAKEGAD
ncbi:ATP-binding protein [Cohnella cellulosilytica]|uniref:histidine kinase n=2 Tax=Cohnella cellulosilytica TaxID=986710 RepID=A0ABW2FG50_9BACL